MVAQKEAKRRPVAIYFVLGTLLLVTVGVRWWVLREPGAALEEAPADVRGQWTTSDARYAGRGIEVSATTVVLQRGDAEPLVGRLTSARAFEAEGDRVVRLEYQTREGPNSLEMVTRPDGTMHLRNQPGIAWSLGGPTTTVPRPTVVETPVPEDDGGVPLRFVLAGLLGIAALGLVGLRLSAGGHVSEPVGDGLAPDIVRGVWTTMDERLEGRTIRIAPGYAFSHFGPGDVRVGGVITEAQTKSDEGKRIVTLEYQRPDGPDLLQLAIDRSGHMRLLNGPKSVWVRR